MVVECCKGFVEEVYGFLMKGFGKVLFGALRVV